MSTVRLLAAVPEVLTLFPILGFYLYAAHQHLHSFPTRRSSDLHHSRRNVLKGCCTKMVENHCSRALLQDRKSTRLNSSHLGISYAVFCLKKKKVLQRLYRRAVGEPKVTRPAGRSGNLQTISDWV